MGPRLFVLCLSATLAACSESSLDTTPEGGSLPSDGSPEGAALSVPEASGPLDASMDSDSLVAALDSTLDSGLLDATLDSGSVDATPDGSALNDAGTDTAGNATSDATTGPSDATTDAPGDSASDGGDAAVREAVYIANYLGGIVALALDPVTAVPAPIAQSAFDVDAAFDNIVLSPTGARIYAGDDHAFIHGYAVGAGGVLAPLARSPYPTAGSALSLAVDPLGRFIYAGSATVDTIAVFAVGDDGSLAPVGIPVTLPVVPTFLAADPSGHFLYATERGAGDGIFGFSISDTGLIAALPSSPFRTTSVFGGAIVFSHDGRFLYAGGVATFAIDPGTGALSEIGTPVPGSVGGSDPNAIDLAMSPSGRFLYGVANFAGTVSVLAVDADAGTLQVVAGSPIDGGSMPYSIAVDPASRLVAVGNDDVGLVSLFTVDTGTGSLLPVPGSPFPAPGLQPQLAITTFSP